jgi:glycosyltransferase involved in cell wall biosynthesis
MVNLEKDVPPELSIVMPCLNEAQTVGICVQKAFSYMKTHNVRGEVIVADNGSTDGSQALAADLGARVVPVVSRGYGSALRAGIEAARGRFVIMGDSDDSYDFSHLEPFLFKLREGCQLVMGNRFSGGIKPGAMPPLHRYLGNPVLSAVGRLFFRSACGDFHCGLRGFDRDAILCLDLAAPGMEGVCLGNGGEGDHFQTKNRRGSDNVITGWPESSAASAQLARWLAASASPSLVQPEMVVPLSGRGHFSSRTSRNADAAWWRRRF